MRLEVTNLDQLAEAADKIIATYTDDRIFLLHGGMGAGKTTLINALCKSLGVTDHTSSPTFSIVNEYASTSGPIFHFDFYRLRNESEAFDMGYEEYFYAGNYCFVEWPEKIANLLPEHYVQISINTTENLTRTIQIKKK